MFSYREGGYRLAWHSAAPLSGGKFTLFKLRPWAPVTRAQPMRCVWCSQKQHMQRGKVENDGGRGVFQNFSTLQTTISPENVTSDEMSAIRWGGQVLEQPGIFAWLSCLCRQTVTAALMVSQTKLYKQSVTTAWHYDAVLLQLSALGSDLWWAQRKFVIMGRKLYSATSLTNQWWQVCRIGTCFYWLESHFHPLCKWPEGSDLLIFIVFRVLGKA